MMKNIKILIGLMILIFVIVLLSGCVQQQRTQDQTATSTTSQKSEILKEMDEINSMVDDLNSLSNSLDELDENEDLLQVFKGD